MWKKIFNRIQRVGRIGITQLYLLYAIGLFISFKSAIPMYANSSFLESFLSEQTVGIVFSTASFLALFILLNIPRLLARFGVYKVTATLLVLDMLALGLLASQESIWLLIPIFIVHFLLSRSLFYVLDVFVENLSAPEKTGSIRGTLLTVLNAATLIAPLILSMILGETENYSLMYYTAAFLVIPAFILLVFGLKNFKDSTYETVNVRPSVARVFRDRDLFHIFSAGFILRFFYAWMVVYTPLYLINTIGFEWGTLGKIFTFMLVPFVFLQIPLGNIADKYLGEQELLVTGFIIMGLSTIALSFISAPTAIIWAIILFMTRVGACFVETMTESYFFKKVEPEDSNIVALFRTLEPLAYIVAPVVSTLTLLVIDIKYTFVVLGIVVISGIISSLSIKDTR